MSELKKMWKETGKEVCGAVESLGKSIVKTAKLGIKKADEWANNDSKSNTKNTENSDNTK